MLVKSQLTRKILCKFGMLMIFYFFAKIERVGKSRVQEENEKTNVSE